MAKSIIIGIIFALIMIGFMLIIANTFIAQPLMGGAEVQAAESIATTLNSACMQNKGYVTELAVFLPDFKKGGGRTEYFYIAVSDYNLLLRERNQAEDIVTSFIDFATQRPGEETVATYPLKACKDKGVQVCILSFDAKEKKCNNFQFESNEGMEMMTFTVNRTYAKEVVMNYTRAAKS